jgi:arsenate reductase
MSDRITPAPTAPARRPSVLFLCTGNSCRSQMAEGFARAMHGHRVDVFSAGVEANGLNELAARAMAEVGVDISGHRSKLVGELRDQPIDLVVTVCDLAAAACPRFPGQARVVHRAFDDPPSLARGAANDEEAMAPYRRVRDEIREFIAAGLPPLLGDLADEDTL